MAKKELPPLDKVISDYPASSPKANPLLQYFAIPLVLFGLLGLIWSIPFPRLEFLGKYNGFVNWASFVIAFSIYYYYRLSPVISYGALLLVFAFSAGIVGLEKVQNNGGPTMGSVCLVIFLVGILLQYFSSGKDGSVLSPRSILVSPVWLIYSILKKAGLKI